MISVDLTQIKEKLDHLKLLLISTECMVCGALLKSKYKICPIHYLVGWSDEIKVKVQGKGLVPSSEVQIGDKVLTYQDGPYVEVMDRWTQKCGLSFDSDFQMYFHQGLIVLNGGELKPYDGKGKDLVEKNLINFGLKTVHTIMLFQTDTIATYAKTY